MAFNHKHLIDITEYSEEDIKLILETAKAFSEVNERAIKKVPTLKGKTIVNMFNEPSTRTRSSFELAEKRLSADSLNFGGSSTSTVKGESLVDTVETLNAYKIDCIVVRDKHAGAPYIVTQNSPASVICAGDGKHNHPTQALLDLYTIWEHKGDFHGLKVAVVGDIAHSRVCGSLIPALKIMAARPTPSPPGTLLPPAPEVLGCDHVTSDLDSVLPELDVVYMLRVQQERLEGAPFPTIREYHKLFGLTKDREKLMKPDAIICHPGPINRGVEIRLLYGRTTRNAPSSWSRSTPVSACVWLSCICCLEVPIMVLLLKNAHVVDPSVELDGVVDVLIDGDKIAEVGENLAAEGAEVRDLSGKYLVPGLVDMHVHLREPRLRGQGGHRERHPRSCQGRLHRRVRHAQHRSRYR